MYLRTPKRYQPGRQRRQLISLRWAWLWVLTPIIVFLGAQVIERREEFGPPVREWLSGMVESARSGIATVTAPTPLPTTDPGQALAQADSAWARGAIEEAMRLYGEVLPNAPNDVTAHYRLTLGLIMEGRGEEALEAAERTLTANPFSSDAWAIRALALDRSGRPQEAVASAMQALSINPNNARALAFLAEAYLDANLVGRAQETIARALQVNPESFEALFVNGLIIRDGQFDFRRAREEFQAAYELAPNLPYIAVELAWSEWYLQNYDVALEILQGVLEQNPQNLDALFATGYLYYQAFGDPNQSLDYLNQCVSADPENTACLRYLATVQTGVGNAQAALQTYRQLIAAGTNRPSDYLNAGRAYMGTGDCASAVPVFQQGYEMERSSPQPDIDLLARFEEFLRDCQSVLNPGAVPAPLPEETAAADA